MIDRHLSNATNGIDHSSPVDLLRRPQDDPADTIAIIGMACRFPGGVDSPEAYWRLLRDGADAINEIPRDRWNIDEYYDSDREAPGKMYARHGGFVESIEGFDPTFFGITPREAEDLDPQQRLLLEVVWESLEQAGTAPSSLGGSETGIFVGLSSDDYAAAQRNGQGLAGIGTYTTLGTARSVAAGRVAYFLGLHGPVIQLDTSCSSSLVAVYEACQSLAAGECDLAIAGGVNVVLSPAVMIALCKLSVLAPDGRCKTFDAEADGYVRGEGCGIVVLKRMKDAIRDRDMILANIRSAVINHDGASHGLTTPNGQAQERLMRKALRKAGLDGRDVAYVEAHGTGTVVGDPIELNALNAVYGKNRSPVDPLYVGSAKTNIGHLEAAAGIAGLLKVVLMLQHREIPPNLHFNIPNPNIPWADWAVKVPTTLQPWPRLDTPRVAAVSSLGISGTNAHLIVEAMNPALSSSPPGSYALTASAEGNAAGSPANEESVRLWKPLRILPLSARSEESLRALAQKLLEHITGHLDQSLEDICFTAAIGRDHFKHRLALVAASRDDLLTELRAHVAGEQTSQVIHHEVKGGGPSTSDKVVFLFTGHGSQYSGMGRDLYETQPVYRAAIDRCDALLQRDHNIRLTDTLYDPTPESQSWINDVAFAQPAIFATEYALAELWQAWGIKPAAVLGHSIGEYAAACVAGAIELEAAIELVATRGRLLKELPQQGTMAAVMASEAKIESVLASVRRKVSIASVNGPEIVVISGDCEAMSDATVALEEAGLDVEQLRAAAAGHSALVEPMLESFAEATSRFTFEAPKIPMISNVSGHFVGEEMADGLYWVKHARSPVRFAEGMQTLTAAGYRTFLEIGAKPNLLAMGMGCVRDRQPRPCWLPSMSEGRNGLETMLYSLAELYARGADVDWHGFYESSSPSRVSLPTYAFDRKSYGSAAIFDSAVRTLDSGTDTRSNARTERSSLPNPSAIATKLAPMQQGLEDESRSLAPRLDEVAVRYIINTFRELGLPWHVGAAFSLADVQQFVPQRHFPKVRRVLCRLVERGFLDNTGSDYRVLLAQPDGAADNMLVELQREVACPEGELLGRAGRDLASIWRGDIEPLTVLFPDGKTDEAVTFYSEARLLVRYNELASAVMREIVASLSQGDHLSVLEVGAGTGGLTTHLLPRLHADRSTYVFTDVSPWFLRAAKERFDRFSSLQTELLDISKSPLEQGFEPRSFDLVVAANVLHATPRLHDTLTHVRQLLKPNGWLMLLEAANPPFWADMVFTLIDGWWHFEDKELRPDYPLMRSDRWCRVLAETGFDEVVCLNDARFQDDSNHTLYLAQANSLSQSQQRCPTTMFASKPGTQPILSRPIPTLAEGLIDMDLRELIREHAARVMRLQPELIDPTVPLSELGMDSLMAIELRTRLGQALGFELSLNPLRMRRSVDEIATYVLADHLNPTDNTESGKALKLEVPRVHLVPLQPKGDQIPLFFVPAGYGDLLAFQDIANAIGMHQPVYGLQPASAKQVKTIRQMSIYRLVSAYIAEIKKVQPAGPYLLSGYSAGAIIAVELARELIRQGDRVNLLVIFDPPSHVPFWLDWLYAFNYQVCVRTGLIRLVRQLRSKPLLRMFHTVLDEGLRTHTTVTREHRVAPYPGRITHFRARFSQSWIVSMRPMGLFWRKVAKEGAEVHWIPGSHYGMLRGHGAAVVVDELYDCLQRARPRD